MVNGRDRRFIKYLKSFAASETQTVQAVSPLCKKKAHNFLIKISILWDAGMMRVLDTYHDVLNSVSLYLANFFLEIYQNFSL